MAQVIGMGQISVANLGRDGSGTLVDVFTAGENGALVQKVEAIATGTTTAGVVRLFINDGTNSRLWEEILVTAITPGVAQEVWSGSVTPAPALPLKAGWKLKASGEKGETFNVIASAFNL